MPSLIVNLVTEAGRINDGQRNAGSLLIQFQLCNTQDGQFLKGVLARRNLIRLDSPTVTGLMRTPSSSWACSGSSASLPSSTCFPQRVLTKVVRPELSDNQRSIPSWTLGGSGGRIRTSSTGTADHQAELNSLLDILLATDLNLPTMGTFVS